MDLIPLPQEAVEITQKCTKTKIIRQLRAKLDKKDTSRSKKLLKKTCINLSDFILTDESLNHEQLDDLIDDMHRTTIYLQKKKRSLKKKKR